MIIRFPRTQAFYCAGGTIRFDAEVDGAQVTCEISPEALEEHFRARPGQAGLLSAFAAHRDEIESIARQTLPHRLSAGRCQLFLRDFMCRATHAGAIMSLHRDMAKIARPVASETSATHSTASIAALDELEAS